MAHPSGFFLRLRPVLLSIVLASSSLAYADALTDQAKALIDQGRSQAAFDLLIPLESARAGEEAYDLLLGIAAVDIGRSSSAVLALERVLAVNPNNTRARAEIARAYFALGEVNTAKQEFEIVKQQGIPAEVTKTIDQFLAAVARLEAEGKTSIKAYAEIALGWDSNVNAATSGSQVAVPALGGAIVTLGAAGVKKADGYSTLAAGVNYRKPIDPRLALTAGVSASKRMNDTQDTFDTGSWDGNVGLSLKEETDVYSLALQAGTFYVDNSRYRDTVGLSGQWQRNFDQRTQATVFVQYADQRFPSRATLFAGKKRDAERWVAGVGFAQAAHDFKTVFYGSAYAGFEDTRSQPTAELDVRLWGLRGGAQHQYRDDLSLFVNANFEKRNNIGKDSFFLISRADDTYGVSIGAAYVPAKNWKVTPQYQRTENRSNIRINTYDRDVVSVTVRHDF
jgi:tetratricopeptide (TPR) repeat protein